MSKLLLYRRLDDVTMTMWVFIKKTTLQYDVDDDAAC
jgi:hypothetical protein